MAKTTRMTPRPVGRPAGRSGLPEPIPGQPFSLLEMLRRTRGTLTVKDVAQVLNVSEKSVYEWINQGKIPVVDLGVDIIRIDPKAWAHQLEHKNQHLRPSLRVSTAA